MAERVYIKGLGGFRQVGQSGQPLLSFRDIAILNGRARLLEETGSGIDIALKIGNVVLPSLYGVQRIEQSSDVSGIPTQLMGVPVRR